MARRKPAGGRDRKNKINLVFDETKRKEFLGGFHKRKVERRKKAQEELKVLLKEERKRIKQENKESYKKLVVSSRPIPELEKLLKDEYEDDDVNVKIVELSTTALGDTDRWIGDNKPGSSSKEPTKAKKIHKEPEVKDEALPGMGLEEQEESDKGNEESGDEPEEHLKTKKDIKRILKRQATKKVQKSKAFQMKNKMERVKNKKKSLQTKHNKEKIRSTGRGNPRKEKAKKIVGRRKH